MKRYDPNIGFFLEPCMQEDPNGEYVKWEDIEEINQILLDLWIQFSDKGTKNGIPHQYSYGLSALESLESYLQENNLIDEHGVANN